MLGISAVAYRGAALTLGGDSPLLAASATLVTALAIQTFVMTAYLLAFESGEITKVWRNRAKASFVGAASMLGSVGWFTAMTLQNAAIVRAVGQVELIFTFLTSVLVFKEKINRYEVSGTPLSWAVFWCCSWIRSRIWRLAKSQLTGLATNVAVHPAGGPLASDNPSP